MKQKLTDVIQVHSTIRYTGRNVVSVGIDRKTVKWVTSNKRDIYLSVMRNKTEERKKERRKERGPPRHLHTVPQVCTYQSFNRANDGTMFTQYYDVAPAQSCTMQLRRIEYRGELAD